MYEKSENKIQLNERDLEISTTRGSGNGGQARNKLETCVVIKDKKTGLSVRCQSERSQYQNKILAMELLEAKIQRLVNQNSDEREKQNRTQQVGNLKRGSDKKIRIYKEKLDLVMDVRTSKKSSLTSWLKGNICL